MISSNSRRVHAPHAEVSSVVVTLDVPIDAHNAPVSLGVPLPIGLVRSDTALRLLNQDAVEIPSQATVLARWRDGSLKWVLLEFIVGRISAGRHAWTLDWPDDVEHRSEPRVTASITSTGKCIVSTSAATLTATPTGDVTVAVNGDVWPIAVSPAGGEWTVAITTCRGTVRATCLLTRSVGHMLHEWEFDVFAAPGPVRVRSTIRNRQAAKHPGGLWDLGDRASHRCPASQFSIRMPQEARILWTAQHSAPLKAVESLDLRQASSGGENWDSVNHVDRNGRTDLAFRGYRADCDGSHQAGMRATPVLSVTTRSSGMAVAIPEFWQQFPNHLQIAQGTLLLDFFPCAVEPNIELQGGEQKTHTVWCAFGNATSDLSWVHEPIRPSLPGHWYTLAEVVPFFHHDCTEAAQFSTLMHEALEGRNNFFAKRETIDEFGWRHFGDLYADHENEHYPGAGPVASHYNNQYDALAGLIFQYFRTADRRWWDLADALARHIYDIDIYHTSSDRAAYNQGMFWHTDHYRSAGTSTHRAYSRSNRQPGRPYGGGPSNEHNWGTGLLYYYYLTGDRHARDAVVGLGDWVIAMDDGRNTVLGLIDDGPTGAASRTGGDLFHGPGRGGGNSITSLLDAWLLTEDARYLEKAESLLVRCIGPTDDLAAMDVTNPEHRWSYTVFLSALARYLTLMEQADRRGDPYWHGRAALLHYGDYMDRRERPYFDQAELLDYPNETWAAQELRKANALRLAARLAPEPQRTTWHRRGDELAERGWHDLFRFETRTSTRSLAIAMTEGTRDCWIRSSRRELAAPEAVQRSTVIREPFTPQRARIKLQLRTLVGAVRACRAILRVWRWPKALRARQL